MTTHSKHPLKDSLTDHSAILPSNMGQPTQTNANTLKIVGTDFYTDSLDGNQVIVKTYSDGMTLIEKKKFHITSRGKATIRSLKLKDIPMTAFLTSQHRIGNHDLT